MKATLIQPRYFNVWEALGLAYIGAHAKRHYRGALDLQFFQAYFDDDATIQSRTVIIATGARYRRPSLPDLTRFEGAGVYYNATFMEAQLCEGDEVVVVGGANSAGQAAVFLAQTAKRVYLLVRSGGLSASMSRYLIRRIEDAPAIEVLTRTELTALEGERHLERVTWRTGSGEVARHDIRHVFLMTGAEANTGWLNGRVALDPKLAHPPIVPGPPPLRAAVLRRRLRPDSGSREPGRSAS